MPKITKAVIAAGGWSTRFLPAVKVYAKQLVPILDKPQIQLVMEELVGAGITDFCIVHREGENTLKQFFTPNPELDAYLKETGKESAMDSFRQLMSRIKSIQFLPQTKAFPYGNGSPILVAESFIGADPFVYLYADDLVVEDQPGAYISSLIQTFTQTQASAVCAAKKVAHEQIRALSSVKFKADSSVKNQIDSVIEKPDPAVAPSDVCIWGRFILSPEIISILKNTPVERGELWLTDAINHLAQAKTVIAQSLPNGSDWITTGDPLNWLKANLTLALKDDRYSQAIKDIISTYP